MNQWSMRVSWLELSLMLKQSANGVSQHFNLLVSVSAHSTIYSFLSAHEDEGGNPQQPA